MPEPVLWVARDEDKYLMICRAKPRMERDGYGRMCWDPRGDFIEIPRTRFPDLKPGQCCRVTLQRMEGTT